MISKKKWLINKKLIIREPNFLFYEIFVLLAVHYNRDIFFLLKVASELSFTNAKFCCHGWEWCFPNQETLWFLQKILGPFGWKESKCQIQEFNTPRWPPLSGRSCGFLQVNTPYPLINVLVYPMPVSYLIRFTFYNPCMLFLWCYFYMLTKCLRLVCWIFRCL
jgi:hypothetical protein